MNPYFNEILRAFSNARVEFLVVGAYALASHGYSRQTGDIDLWVKPVAHNATLVMSALIEFGAPLFGLTEADLCEPGNVFQIGLPPSRIDVLTEISGVTFEDAWASRKLVTLEGVEVAVPSLTILKKNKLSTGRPKDQLDVLAIEALEKKS